MTVLVVGATGTMGREVVTAVLARGAKTRVLEGVNRLDLRDVAEVVARALTDPAFPGGAHSMVGPESLSGAHCAELWDRALHRSVRVQAPASSTARSRTA